MPTPTGNTLLKNFTKKSAPKSLALFRESLPKRQSRGILALNILDKEFPHAKCALNHEGPFQLLIATILSAQCTDLRVNLVTPELFRQAPTPQAMVALGEEKIRELIRSINFFNNKAKNILSCSEKLITEHNAQVPQTMNALAELPGVGRKTANVVLGNAFNIPGMVVDTHVTRLANRLGLLKAKLVDAVKIEAELEKVFPSSWWIKSSHLLILHGRKTCSARKPLCVSCPIQHLCPSAGKA